MCWFVLQHALCGHHEPKLLAGPSCRPIFEQLQRIHDAIPGTPGSVPQTDIQIPFQMDPRTCEPNAGNTVVVGMWCGWECRNTFDPMGVIEGMGMRWSHSEVLEGGGEEVVSAHAGMGEPGARFGEPRLGIGWRD
ncbi:hypothetical protein JX265_002301 [Neoarthrinium moseri]|uniref:Uncharacterized protein n=1 Tax=Neoarthrinium moseri TaxID=1658444 RepID=A0A9P9WUN6_9PEZI|nr:hypothetical protein JX265_002301 [Neoarthrinium moseri]